MRDLVREAMRDHGVAGLKEGLVFHSTQQHRKEAVKAEYRVATMRS
jgi:hypothetical protein